MANAVAATEIYFHDQSCDDMNVDEFTSCRLLMSFLEDSQADQEGDDEMLRAMIKSLEPEIMNQDSCFETYCSDDGSSEECRFSEVDQLECCSISPHHYHQGFEWIDMEMDYSCPSYEITGYFISRDMVELGGLEDYSQVCHGMPMEEDGYVGLWQ